MAYNPSLYNPYGSQQFQPTVSYPATYQSTFQPTPSVNGLVRIESIEGAQMYQLPPNSVSPPLFLGEENAFFIKTTDGGGAATLKKYTFAEAPITDNNSDDFVTREYFDQQMNNIMEAINGKYSVSGQQPANEQQQFTPQPDPATQATRSV